MTDYDSDETPHLIASRFRGFLPVVVDIETGGFDCQTDAVLEIAATTLTMDDDGILKIDKTYAYNVQPFPGANLEPAALEFTGIDPHHPFREADAEEKVFEELLQGIRKQVKNHDCNRAILVGHNAHFDHGFMMAAVERCSIKRNPFHPFSVFDTATLSGLAFGQTVLAKSCQAAGISFDNAEAHSAAYDTEKTAELFCSIINKWKNLGGWDIAASLDD